MVAGQYGRKEGTTLCGAVRWPTPTVSDYKGSALTGNRADREATLLRGSVGEASGMRLNPDWVEWLMGYPIGWTDATVDVVGDPLPFDTDPHETYPRVTDRKDFRAKRLHALGNAIVPQVAAIVARQFRHLTGDLCG